MLDYSIVGTGRYFRRQGYSNKALKVIDIANRSGIKLYSDPDWSKAEASGLETPTGSVHLHWVNRHGRGHWNVLKLKSPNSVCKTVRCRVVILEPIGGENESCDINQQTLQKATETWYNNKIVEMDQHLDIVRDTPREFRSIL